MTMNILTTALGGRAALLPGADWDLVSFFENAGDYVKLAGGALIVAFGLVGVVWGTVLLLKKLMSSQGSQDSWIKIIGLIIVGGAIAAGGFGLIYTIASGGQQTIEDLGGGAALITGSGASAFLPGADWDLVSFFENAGDYVKLAGGALIVAFGLVGVVWGTVLLLKKLMSSQGSQDSWIKIIGLIIVGGAIAAGGFGLIYTIASGGQQTIEDLGGGAALLTTYLGRG